MLRTTAVSSLSLSLAEEVARLVHPLPTCQLGPTESAPLSPHLLYDQVLLCGLRAGAAPLAALLCQTRYQGYGRSRSTTGVTLAMRACRYVGHRPGTVAVLRVLLDQNCDVQQHCDASRNLLHDLFWGSPGMSDVMFADVESALSLLCHRVDAGTMLLLLGARDNHSFLPDDYLGQQRRPSVSLVLRRSLCLHTDSGPPRKNIS